MSRIDPKKLKKLNELEEAFLENLMSTEYSDDPQGVRMAYVDAGYADGKQATSNARLKMRELNKHIEVRVHERIGEHVTMALEGLAELAKSAKTETVKLRAIMSILDRAGYNAPIVIEHKKDNVQEMTKQQLMAELERKMKNLIKNGAIPPELKAITGGKK